MNSSDADQQPLFLQQPNNVSRVLRQLKKEDSSLFNCACSVSEDATFVDEVSRLYSNIPLVPNLRCGLWYVRNGDPTCYFKSTDGHNGNWSFSTTRLNLHIAELAAAKGGCIIVDATRRGKTFPDALTKTVPIWAAVLNRAVGQLRSYHDGTRREGAVSQAAPSPAGHDWDTSLHLPSWISQNERVQIEARLDQWVRDLVQVTGDVGRLAAVLDKPLRPIWLSQESRMWTNAMTDKADLPFTPLYLVSASKPTPQRRSIEVGHETVSYSYVPGAGDDEESWARGLTPALFWQHHQALLAAGPHGVNSLVGNILKDTEQERGNLLSSTMHRPKHSPGVTTDKHHPAPSGVEMSQTPLLAHGLFWIGTSGLALGPPSAAHPSFVWQHVDAVLDVSTPSAKELKAAQSMNANSSASEEPPAQQATDMPALTEPPAQQGNAEEERCARRLPGAHLRLPVAKSKADKHSLQKHLPAALEFVSHHLAQQHRVLLHCDAGDDACVCLAVAVHLACFQGCSNDAGVLHFVKQYDPSQHPPGSRLLTPDGRSVSKHSIRQVLAIVSRFNPLARPTRGMLKQVFNFFEPPHKLPQPSPQRPLSAATETSPAEQAAAAGSQEAADPATAAARQHQQLAFDSGHGVGTHHAAGRLESPFLTAQGEASQVASMTALSGDRLLHRCTKSF